MNQTKTIDGLLLREMAIAGAALLEKNREMVDALNVFPVPDGDTGTNMSLTMASAIREINQKEYDTAAGAAEALSKGALRGARGNSGVITSQILRGFSKALGGAETISPQLFASALQKGAETAYKAVMKPKEGTILTVARVIAEDAVRQAENAPDDFDALFSVILKSGEAILQRTPDMLPVLKQAGVVDAGGRGLMFILSGFYAAIRGSSYENENEANAPDAENHSLTAYETAFTYSQDFRLKYLKDTVTDDSMQVFRRQLNRIGDNVSVVRENDEVYCHLNTDDPGKAIQFGLEIGEIIESSIINLREEDRKKNPPQQTDDTGTTEKQHRHYGFVSVSLGEGFASIFHDLQVDVIVDGGQTMNPSIEDIQTAAESIPADIVFVLPNNGNVILAAQQAAELSEREIHVIPTKNVAMGIAAVVAFQPDADTETNLALMEEASQHVRTGTVTYAVRNSVYEEMSIEQGDIIGLTNGKIACKDKDIAGVALHLMEDIVTEDDGLITLYYGQDVSEEEAQSLGELIGEKYPDCDVDVYSGGQPLYYYIISVE